MRLGLLLHRANAASLTEGSCEQIVHERLLRVSIQYFLAGQSRKRHVQCHIEDNYLKFRAADEPHKHQQKQQERVAGPQCDQNSCIFFAWESKKTLCLKLTATLLELTAILLA